ncbi:TonB-dependent receptor [Sphingomonas sp. PR090111-T3T-6A]|uniref:TonB-dependent receptor n=1 Tax=Sphingomonas sp. PR090111-T3T-6A TaxID=685778 RepID=UPI000365B039|nr:TonB-dependent receptor [Sphingomonas sp. PR090111-T3T-6A]
MRSSAARARTPLRLALLASAICYAAPSLAQTVTGSIRGAVAHGAGAQITAVDTGNGSSRHATADGRGAYTLSGLRPGTYDISFTAGGRSVKQRVIIGVGENSTLDVDLAPAPETATGGTPTQQIVVTGRRLVETRTSELGTNITTQQIENLPQASRNFLNFAQLAPGVRVSTNPTRKTFSGSGVSEDPNGESLGGPQVNVFIDGVSLKSDINQGGIVGGDSSKGNPFPQAAVQEFRVITSNYKAEYEDAGTTVISAVTKSGGNEFHGEAFGFFQLNALRSKDYFQKQNAKNGIADTSDFSQKQYGVSLGGPIVKDKLHFFVAYEANEQSNVESVVLGRRTEPGVLDRFGQYEGTFDTPFREDLGFAKLTLEATEADTIDLSGSIRKEKDLQGFGAQTARTAASDVKNDVYTGRIRWAHNKGDFLNEASLDYLYFKFAPTPDNPDAVQQAFDQTITIGGASTSQRVVQKGFTLRDNMTFSNVDFLGGNHVIKVGGKVAFVDYTVNNDLNANPIFKYRIDPALNEDFTQPYEANYGIGDPTIHAKDTQIGIFAQDDWKATDHVTFNIGLRWDYETNAKNNDYVTPPDAATALRNLETALNAQGVTSFKAADYISNGHNRKPFWKAFQPRIGVSFDVFGDQRTVFFAGWGRYYDRALFRNAAEEALFRQFSSRTFEFSKDGGIRDGKQTILWNDSYLSKQGLDGLIAQSSAPPGELRIIRNDIKPPRTDQFSLGVRQKIGRINTSIAYNHVAAMNQIAYYPVNRMPAPNATGGYDAIPVPGFGDVIALTQARASKYDGMYVTVDKPFTKSSPWSLNIAYTLSFSKERGYAFNFDHPDVADQPYLPNAGDERHRVVVSGLAQLPWDFQISTLMVFASGQPYQVTDQRLGSGAFQTVSNVGHTKPFRQVDIRLTKDIRLFGHDRADFQLIAEVFNIFDRANFQNYDGFLPTPPLTNANFGTPNTLSGPPRTFQFGARFSF